MIALLTVVTSPVKTVTSATVTPAVAPSISAAGPDARGRYYLF